MSEILQALLAAVWLVGAGLRIVRQARFYQIEEYMNGRYLRWVASGRERWLPARSISAWMLGMVIGALLAEAPGSFLPAIVALLAAIVAVSPPRQSEVKKSLAVTPRMKRLLLSAWAICAMMYAAALGAGGALLPIEISLVPVFVN